jgi:hypothetical protein
MKDVSVPARCAVCRHERIAHVEGKGCTTCKILGYVTLPCFRPTVFDRLPSAAPSSPES